MHIPDAILDPRVAMATSVLGAAGLFHALRVVERQLKERTTSLMGMMAAFVFAAQMVNFPVGPGVSGHLLGGVLAAVVLGPWAGAVVIGAVLIVQCFLFGDGGLTALGANFVNMGLIGSVGGYAIYAPLRRLIGGRRGILIAAMVAAWFAVLLAAGACALELSASGHRQEFFRTLSWMALVHAAIGLGEAVITGLVVRFILLTRPELIEPDDETTGESRADCARASGCRRCWPAWASPLPWPSSSLRSRPRSLMGWNSSASGSACWRANRRPPWFPLRCPIINCRCPGSRRSRPRRRSPGYSARLSSSG